LSIGEDEIVTPMPLWAQMGRGRLSATDQLMAPAVAPAGYAPPLGSYPLVMPPPAPFDFTEGGPFAPGAVQVGGPTGLQLIHDPSQGSVFAQRGGGSFRLASVPVDEPGSSQV